MNIFDGFYDGKENILKYAPFAYDTMLTIDKDYKLNELEAIKEEKKSIGLLPTMGALHEGHLSLAKRAKNENDVLICSVFVNPIQFNNQEDLEKYPRDLEGDLALLEGVNCDFVFAPSAEEVYAEKPEFTYSFGKLENVLEGPQRPGHFNGVATIVHKLFNWSKADKAYFGEKDFQQYKLLDGMVKSFFLDVNLIPCPIIREKSGLAISSRNRKLSETGKEKAALLHQVISEKTNLQEKQEKLEKEGFVVDYITEKDNRIFVAAFLEDVRLIDNVLTE